jgi:hypothetical protein
MSSRIQTLIWRVTRRLHWDLQDRLQVIADDQNLQSSEKLRQKAQAYRAYLKRMQRELLDTIPFNHKSDQNVQEIWEHIQHRTNEILKDFNKVLSQQRLDKKYSASLISTISGGKDNFFFEVARRLDQKSGPSARATTNPAEAGQEKTKDSVDEEPSIAASAWTGISSKEERIAVVKTLVPIAQREIEQLILLIEERRYNDPETAEALDSLRALHSALGDFLSAMEEGISLEPALGKIGRYRESMSRAIAEGAKLAVAAPAMTLGVTSLLSFVTGLPVDTQLLGTVYGSMVGADALKTFARKRP